uniref:Uncharacterized protein n=1 Tax=Anguilla anguilla TaxID=7936 RepID=A0A0E9ULL4_ANGAN
MICGYGFNGMSGFTVRWDGGYFMLPIRHRQNVINCSCIPVD